jgi:hypothetical protein
MPTSTPEPEFTRVVPLVSASLLVGAQISELEDSGPGPVTWGAVRAHFTGAKIAPIRVLDHGDPAHGSFAPPCKSCSRLLADLDIEVLEP